MKNISLLLTVIVATVFVGCSTTSSRRDTSDISAPGITASVTRSVPAKCPSDAEIRQKVVGKWSPILDSGDTDTSTITEMRRDGSFVSKRTTDMNEKITIEGGWNSEGGVMVLTATNAIGADLHKVGLPIQHFKIFDIEKDEMIYQDETSGLTNLFTLKRIP